MDAEPPSIDPFEALPEPVRRELSEAQWRRAVEVADLAVGSAIAQAQGIEFATYGCATRLPRELADAPARVESFFRLAVRMAMRARLALEWPARTHLTDAPDVTVEASPAENSARLVVAPVLVYGRYCKTERGISQTVFHCRECRGKRRRRGRPCTVCAATGRMVAEAVEEFVTEPLRLALGGTGTSFHGAGREDVDVRMLGDGRPFVVSVHNPRRRAFDAGAVAQQVAELSGGRVTVSGLRVTDKATRKRVTTELGDKEYRAWVRRTDGGSLPREAAEALERLDGAVLEQRTPIRVSGRRSDRVRLREVRSLTVEEAGPDEIVLRVRTQSGTYVKEFVSGDEGRTRPSVAEALACPVACAALDVLSVGEPDATDEADQSSGASSSVSA